MQGLKKGDMLVSTASYARWTLLVLSVIDEKFSPITDDGFDKCKCLRINENNACVLYYYAWRLLETASNKHVTLLRL